MLTDNGRIAYPLKETASPNVLIVDDEPDIIELLELTLTRMGMEICSAMSISDAKILLQSRQFQLCLTDMRLPDGEGLDLVKYIVHHCTDLPVISVLAHEFGENFIFTKAGTVIEIP